MERTTGDEDRAALRQALRLPRGRYQAPRAAQLSGIPERTVYDWAHQGVLVPDFLGAKPMRWSYRDLVYLRLLAQLRAQGMDRENAARRVRLVRSVAGGGEVDEVRTTDRGVLLPGEHHDRLSGETTLGDLSELTARFDLLAPIAELGGDQLWGPDLVKPSTRTCISPEVLGGEPCIDGTRIATASLHALVDRRMNGGQVVALYPQLTEEDVDDAAALERRMRNRPAA